MTSRWKDVADRLEAIDFNSLPDDKKPEALAILKDIERIMTKYEATLAELHAAALNN